MNSPFNPSEVCKLRVRTPQRANALPAIIIGTAMTNRHHCSITNEFQSNVPIVMIPMRVITANIQVNLAKLGLGNGDKDKVDVPVTQAVIYGWYDNELGSYTNLLADRTVSIAEQMV